VKKSIDIPSGDARGRALLRELGRLGGDTGPSAAAQVGRLLDAAGSEGAVAAAIRWFVEVLTTGAFAPNEERMAFLGADFLLQEMGVELPPPDADFWRLMADVREGRRTEAEVAGTFRRLVGPITNASDGRR
jgi:hypothetical protein